MPMTSPIKTPPAAAIPQDIEMTTDSIGTMISVQNNSFTVDYSDKKLIGKNSPQSKPNQTKLLPTIGIQWDI